MAGLDDHDVIITERANFLKYGQKCDSVNVLHIWKNQLDFFFLPNSA